MNTDRHRPPKLPEWILTKLSKRVDKFSLLDDLEYEFAAKNSNHGKIRSRTWYWIQALRAIPSILLYSLFRSAVMAKNYATIALRNIRKHRSPVLKHARPYPDRLTYKGKWIR